MFLAPEATDLLEVLFDAVLEPLDAVDRLSEGEGRQLPIAHYELVWVK